MQNDNGELLNYFRFLKQFSLVPRQTNVLFSKRHVGFL